MSDTPSQAAADAAACIAPAAPAGVTVRAATAADIPLVVDYRWRMFRELGWEDESRLEQITPAAVEHLTDGFATGGCSGFIAEADGAAVASVVVVWQRVPPSPRNLIGLTAYILGMYALPEYRRRGIARTLMTACIDCATDAGAPAVMLHASEFGQPLYEGLGFSSTTEMRLFTKHAGSSAWR
jgi:GNAT superfamily N-acetyltransferase